MNSKEVQSVAGYTMVEEYEVPTDPMDELQCDSCQ